METLPLMGERLTVFGEVEDRDTVKVAALYGLDLQPLAHSSTDFHLRCIDGQLVLYDQAWGNFWLDQKTVKKRSRGFRQSLLARACDVVSKPRILDALGGWGTDSILLAQAGAAVTYCEREPLVSLLAQDRARLMHVAIQFHTLDVSQFLASTEATFEVVYLDPMFGDHPSGALPAKSMQVLSELAQPTDLSEVFELAVSRATNRVVVKQRRKHPTELAVPDWSLTGRTVRFDVYRT